MEQINQKWDKILGLLFEYPNQRFTVREISKKTEIPSSSVQRYLEKLRNEGLVDENKLIVGCYTKFLKTFFILDKIYKSGLIDYLENKLVPETIILFGGVRKGDYDYESDIDLFVSTTKNVDLDLKKFEDKLNHKIQIFIRKDIKELQPHLLNNVVNGIKLKGYFRIK